MLIYNKKFTKRPGKYYEQKNLLVSHNAKTESVHLDRDVSPEGLRSHVGRSTKHCGGLDEGGCVCATSPQSHQPKVTNLPTTQVT